MATRPSPRRTSGSAPAGAPEQPVLWLVSSKGLVPEVIAEDLDEVLPRRVVDSVADLLTARGPLPEAECRGIGAQAAHALSAVHVRGFAHGNMGPSSLVFTPDGGLLLVDSNAATAAVTRSDDIVSIALLVVECATGVLIDPGVRWPRPLLIALGCSADLAADLVVILNKQPSATRVAAVLRRHDHHLPAPVHQTCSPDQTPTVALATTAIAGLDPIGAPTSGPTRSAPKSRAWRRRGRRLRDRDG